MYLGKGVVSVCLGKDAVSVCVSLQATLYQPLGFLSGNEFITLFSRQSHDELMLPDCHLMKLSLHCLVSDWMDSLYVLYDNAK